MVNEKARLRRYEDDLYVSGIGSIIMGVWAVVKIIMEIFLGSADIIHLEAEDQTEKVIGIIISIVVVAALSYFVLRVHFYIGLNAMRAAQGKEYKKGYLTVTIVMMIIYILGMYSYKTLFTSPDSTDTTIATVLVDLTTIYIFVIVIRSANLIKKIKENMRE